LQSPEISRKRFGFRHDDVIAAWLSGKSARKPQSFFKAAFDAVAFNRAAYAFRDRDTEAGRAGSRGFAIDGGCLQAERADMDAGSRRGAQKVSPPL